MSTASRTPAQRLADVIREAPARPALVAYLTANYPTPAKFREILPAVAATADVVEIGVPFSDPMADGATIQHSSRVALEQGVTLRGIIEELRERPVANGTPLVLMGYLNPFLQYGLERLGHDAATAGVTGLIVPDLPLDEAGPLHDALLDFGLALVPLVSPVTTPARLEAIGQAARGFVYAVTVTGVTGSTRPLGSLTAGRPHPLSEYLDRVRLSTHLPVCAGFGIRSPADVAALAPHCDGVVVGSALIECIDRGEDPAAFLQSLRPPASSLNPS